MRSARAAKGEKERRREGERDKKDGKTANLIQIYEIKFKFCFTVSNFTLKSNFIRQSSGECRDFGPIRVASCTLASSLWALREWERPLEFALGAH